jgi:hypothetical protein
MLLFMDVKLFSSEALAQIAPAFSGEQQASDGTGAWLLRPWSFLSGVSSIS